MHNKTLAFIISIIWVIICLQIENAIPSRLRQPEQVNEESYTSGEQGNDSNQQQSNEQQTSVRKSNGHQPSEQQSGEQQSGEQQSGEQQSNEKQPDEQQPSEEHPSEEQPIEEQPIEEQPTEKQPSEDKPTGMKNIDLPSYKKGNRPYICPLNLFDKLKAMDKCNALPCPYIYDPVCATSGEKMHVFANDCLLKQTRNENPLQEFEQINPECCMIFIKYGTVPQLNVK